MDPMDTPASIIDKALAAIGQVLGTGAGITPGPQTPTDALRLLAVLDLATRRVLEEAAASSVGFPVRAAALAHLAESIYRTGSYGQILAAGACDAAEVNTLTDQPLAELNQVLQDPESFAAGTTNLPLEVVSGADRKPLHQDTAEFLKNQLHLGYFQAKHRTSTHDRLMDHQGPDGETLPPSCPTLGRALTKGTADPKMLANAAAKLATLEPTLDAQPDPEQARNVLEEQIIRTAHTADENAVGKLIKQAALALEHSSVEREEEATARHLGLRFRGHKSTRYHWEFITDLEGHEFLCTVADDLNNPRSASGTTPNPDTASDPDAEADAASDAASGSPSTQPALFADPRDGAPIPAWAINPDTPEELRPRAGFTDLVITLPASNPYGLPDGDQYPDETRQEASTRRRAQRLSQALFDAMRLWMDPAAAPAADLPMKSRIELLVMIDYAALTGALDTAGFTSHGELISAATARRMACNGGIIPVVMGGDSQPLDLGRRKRFFSRAQKLAIAPRDRGCANPGCSMPVHRTEVHHITPFSEGGMTDVSDGLLLCIRCHTALHAGHFSIVIHQGIPHVVLPKSRDPLQRPLRNWVFHPEAAAA